MLVHPGGPFWAGKDEGAWSISKGLFEGQEGLVREAPTLRTLSIQGEHGRSFHNVKHAVGADAAAARRAELRGVRIRAALSLPAGTRVGLGSDGMSSDMLSQMRCAYLLHRLANHDPRVAFMEAPKLLLQNNADIVERQFGIRVGELAEGRPADLAIMDYQPPTVLSDANFLGHLIFGLVDATVDTTVCRGQILMQNKKLLTMDEERIAARSRELAPQMWQRLAAL